MVLVSARSHLALLLPFPWPSCSTEGLSAQLTSVSFGWGAGKSRSLQADPQLGKEKEEPVLERHAEGRAGGKATQPASCWVEGKRSWFVQKAQWGSRCSERKLRQSQGPPCQRGLTHFLTGSSPCFISSRMAVGAV